MLVGGGGLHLGLRLLCLMAQRSRLHRVRVWAARQRIAFDRLLDEPASCGLNQALTELGLALLRVGDADGAKDSLVRSGEVYPCPESTLFFGLDSRLWVVMRERADSAELCAEYERTAKKFYLISDWPPKTTHIPVIRRVGAVISHSIGRGSKRK